MEGSPEILWGICFRFPELHQLRQRLSSASRDVNIVGELYHSGVLQAPETQAMKTATNHAGLRFLHWRSTKLVSSGSGLALVLVSL